VGERKPRDLTIELLSWRENPPQSRLEKLVAQTQQYNAEDDTPEGRPAIESPHDPGGRKLKPVMSTEQAAELQDVIDVALKNGHKLNISDAAKRFGVNRDRISQAIVLREDGYDLRESPPEFRAVSRSDGNVRWPTVKKPSKS
jgi:hypothetical protein